MSYHPRLDRHTMLTNNEVFFGAGAGTMVNGRSYLSLVNDLVFGGAPAIVVAD